MRDGVVVRQARIAVAEGGERRRIGIADDRARLVVLEDDYDGEFRYDVAPLPALFGLDPDVVVYLGTTTKTLTPALRVGWLVARPELVSRLVDVAAGMGEWAREHAQRAVLTLVASALLPDRRKADLTVAPDITATAEVS